MNAYLQNELKNISRLINESIELTQFIIHKYNRIKLS